MNDSNYNTHISRSKDNRTIKSGHLIECTLRNIPEKSHIKYDGETSLKPLSQKSKLDISQNQQSKVSNRLFLLYV